MPAGATVIFSAHGVSPEVRAARPASASCEVIDATCPLVSKVHAEARRFAAAGYDIVLVGHEGHEEVEGTFGQAPEHTHVIASIEDVAGLNVKRPRAGRLSDPDDAGRGRHHGRSSRRCAPGSRPLVGPASSDICYATQNRQDAVRALADRVRPDPGRGLGQLVQLRRLVEVAERAGCRALLVEDAADIPPGGSWSGSGGSASPPERPHPRSWSRA